MNAAVILIVGIVILALGYVFYGGWLSKQWGIDPSRTTPAHAARSFSRTMRLSTVNNSSL